MRRTALALAWLLLLAPGAAGAQIAESKRALILELVRLAGGPEDSSERLAQAFLGQIRALYPTMVEQVLDEERTLGEEERAKLATHFADFERFAQAFSARFAERVDLAALLESVYLPLYDERFSEAELRQIVDFYRTPAGRKTVAVMPELLQEGLDATILLVQPRVMELVGEILAEERQRALGAPPPDLR
jgi:hypothetical protein